MFHSVLWSGNSLPPFWSRHAFSVHFRPQGCFLFREKKINFLWAKEWPRVSICPKFWLHFLNKGAFLRSTQPARNNYLFNFSAQLSFGHSLVSFFLVVTVELRSVFSDWPVLSLSCVLRHPDAPLQQRALRLPAHPPEAPSDPTGGHWEPHPCADRSNEWVTQRPGSGSCSVATVNIPATFSLSQDWNLTAISQPRLKHSCSFVHSFSNFSYVKYEYDKVFAFRELPFHVESWVPSKYIPHSVLRAIMVFCLWI